MRERDARAQRLRELLRRLVRGIGLLERGDAACCGITLSQCHALGELAAQEGLTPGELAARLGVDPSAVTRITDALVQQGLVRREGDPSDRRVVRLMLTPEGGHLWAQVQETMLDRSRSLLGLLPPHRQVVVLRALEHVVEALEQEGHLLRCADKGGTCHGQQRARAVDTGPV
ncbi:MAG: MarR family transcriptional regulator [Bacillota bacterium]|nr:MarR family transcriptional regulator [Bacillota bacterium]